ncbi:MAG: hypothetical protein UHC59_08995 [Fibrobacteraceae bacterium]|nr:hypothetical protein [Fibrobacteraceae bacterium]
MSSSTSLVPLLNEQQKEGLSGFLEQLKEYTLEYKEMVCETMGIDKLSDIYFNVSRDLKVCYYDVPYHPFHPLWNAYSLFARCEIIEISDPSELETVKPIVKD